MTGPLAASDVLVLLGVLAAAAALAWLLRRREGRLRRVDGERLDPAALARLGVDPGARVLIEFTAPYCITCAAARTVLDEVAESHDVRVVTADVADHLDLARTHHVLRAPTTLVVEGGGVRHRVHGIPDADELRAVLDTAR